MIQIKEIKPIKVSGLTSFLVSFEYNAEIINAIKALTTSYYLKKLQAWEVGIPDLAMLLDSLTLIDDIKLELQDEKDVKLQKIEKQIEWIPDYLGLPNQKN